MRVSPRGAGKSAGKAWEGGRLIASRAAQRISAGKAWAESPAISDTCGRPMLHGWSKIILPVIYA